MNHAAENQTNEAESLPTRNFDTETMMDRWLERDTVALAILVLGIAVVELFAFGL